jgi:hypothetical protein
MTKISNLGKDDMLTWTVPILFLAACLSGIQTEVYRPLFVIERSTNANVIHYDAKLGSDGMLDPSEPVVAYWIMAAEDGRRLPLSQLERNYAYGFTIQKKVSKSAYRMVLVSQKEREILIIQNAAGVHAETMIGGHSSILNKIFVKTRLSGLLRTADYIELYGVDVVSGAKSYEKILSRH